MIMMDIDFCFKALIFAVAVLQISTALVIPQIDPSQIPFTITPLTNVTNATSTTRYTGTLKHDIEVEEVTTPKFKDVLSNTEYAGGEDINDVVTGNDGPTSSPTIINSSPIDPQENIPKTTIYDQCVEPEHDALRLQLKSANMHRKLPEIAVITAEKLEVDGSKDISIPIQEPHAAILYSNATCPTELLDVQLDHMDINMRSICPWTLKEDTNMARYPPTFMVAQCRCPSCINPSSRAGRFLHDGQSTCRPVTFKMKVLHRRECVMGIYMYESVYEEIPVACSCVRNVNL